MALILLILFIAVPVIEIGLFVEIGGRIGLGPTLAVVILTAVVGTALLRHQGLDTLRRVQESLAQDRLPVAEMFDGLCLLFAGALLLTPGFLTDAVGFLLFVPPMRALAARAIGRAIMRHGQINVSGISGVRPENAGGRTRDPHPPGGGSPTVIDGDYEDVTADSPLIRSNPVNKDKD